MKKIKKNKKNSKFILTFLIYFLVASSMIFVNKVYSADFKKQGFKYYANNERLSDLIVNFATSINISASVSEKIDDVVSGNFSSKEPEEFLNYISSLYNLAWYFDGAIVYIYKSSEVKSSLFQLENISVNELKSSLISSGVWDKYSTWKPLYEKASVYVVGTPQYLKIIENFTEVLEKNIKKNTEKFKNYYLEIVPLKYASALDRDVSYRGKNIIIPGIATILNNILTSVNKPDADKLVTVITAEPSINAIIIRDTKERVAVYRRLIEKLDKPQTQIEVTLSIVDINVSNLKQVGIDWKAGLSLGSNSIIDFNLPNIGSNNQLGNGLDFTSVLDEQNMNYLVAKINLLQTNGDAQIVSRPMLLTQENVQAVLSTSETFYIKLVGVETQSVEQVTSGMVFKITPRIVGNRNSEKPEINLSLQIEDGFRATDVEIDGLPTTQKTEMNTLATVKQGQSLLIGGVYRDELSQQLKKIPLLGDLPYIGNLFTSKINRNRKTARLFIVEPRIITEAIGNNFNIENSKSLKTNIMTIDRLSNDGLKEVSEIYQCKPFYEVNLIQQKIYRQGIASTKHPCYLPDGSAGMKILSGDCSSMDPNCLKPK